MWGGLAQDRLADLVQIGGEAFLHDGGKFHAPGGVVRGLHAHDGEVGAGAVEHLGHAQGIQQVDVVDGEALLLVVHQLVLGQMIDRAGPGMAVDDVQDEHMGKALEQIEDILGEGARFHDGDVFGPGFPGQGLGGVDADTVVGEEQVADTHDKHFVHTILGTGVAPAGGGMWCPPCPVPHGTGRAGADAPAGTDHGPVSYTHLTLPTIA